MVELNTPSPKQSFEGQRVLKLKPLELQIEFPYSANHLNCSQQEYIQQNAIAMPRLGIIKVLFSEIYRNTAMHDSIGLCNE
jgi:hypothetical protein